MTKQKIIDPELKQAINFSNLNSLEEGLGIALGQKWSEVSINDVPEDKIEFVKKWVKEKQSQHRDINIHIGRTYIRDWVIIFSSIDELKEGLNRAVKENLREIIIDDVPEDKIKVIQNWIKKNKGKFEGIKVSIKKTLRDLTVEDEETFEMKYSENWNFRWNAHGTPHRVYGKNIPFSFDIQNTNLSEYYARKFIEDNHFLFEFELLSFNHFLELIWLCLCYPFKTIKLLVKEEDKQDIQWESSSIDDAKFN